MKNSCSTRRYRIFATIILLLSSASASTQNSELENYPNSFTPATSVPFGCLFVPPRIEDLETAALDVDETVSVMVLPVGSLTDEPADIRIRIGRVGCYDGSTSVVLINFDLLSGPSEFYAPAIDLVSADSDSIAQAALTRFFRSNPRSAYSVGPISDPEGPGEGVTLSVDTELTDFSITEYNDAITMQLRWDPQSALDYEISAYDPAMQPSQFSAPPLHGRHSGQWIVEGQPRQGLVLQIGEIGDRNFLFAIFFTYLNGETYWTVGNADFSAGANEVVVDLLELQGGGFITEGPGAYGSEDVETEVLGQLLVRVRDCDSLTVEYDLSQAGLGVQSLIMQRLIDLAGYDCDQAAG